MPFSCLPLPNLLSLRARNPPQSHVCPWVPQQPGVPRSGKTAVVIDARKGAFWRGEGCGDSGRGVRGALLPVCPGPEAGPAVLQRLEEGGRVCERPGPPESSGPAPPARPQAPLGGRRSLCPGRPPWASQAMPSSAERWALGGEACESAGKCENGFNGDLDPDDRRAGGNAKRQVIRDRGPRE